MFRKEKEKLPEVKPASMVTGSNIKTSSFIYSKAQSKMSKYTNLSLLQRK